MSNGVIKYFLNVDRKKLTKRTWSKLYLKYIYIYIFFFEKQMILPEAVSNCLLDFNSHLTRTRAHMHIYIFQ